VAINVILSPACYGVCDFHFVENQQGHLGILPDLQIRILAQQQGTQTLKYSLKQAANAKNQVEMEECFRFATSFLSSCKSETIKQTEMAEKFEYLKQHDNKSKRLWFLWTVQEPKNSLCACSGNSEFFSALVKPNFYDFSEDFSYKPCLLTQNRVNPRTNSTTYGFGQSLVQPNQMSIFGDRTFMPECRISSVKIKSSTEFIVLANMESHNSLRSKFEPIEICVYNTELVRFVNESIDAALFKDMTLETVYLNSANMSPCYFSNEFNIYIRYLPLVKNISKTLINLDMKKSSGMSDCIFQEIRREAVKHDNPNPPHSDLDLEYVKKYRTQGGSKKYSFPKVTFSNSGLSIGRASIDLSLNSSIEDLRRKSDAKKKESLRKKSVSDRRKSSLANKRSIQANNEQKIYSGFSLFKFNVNQINSGFKLKRVNTENRNFAIEEVFMKTIAGSKRTAESIEAATSQMQESSFDRSKSEVECVNIGVTRLLVTPQSLDLISGEIDYVSNLMDSQFQDVVSTERLLKFEQANLKYITRNGDQQSGLFSNFKVIETVCEDFSILTGTEIKVSIKKFDFDQKTDDLELNTILFSPHLISFINKAFLVLSKIDVCVTLSLGSLFKSVSAAEISFKSLYSIKTRLQEKWLMVNVFKGSLEYLGFYKLLDFLQAVLADHQTIQADNKKYRFKFNVNALNFRLNLKTSLYVDLELSSLQLTTSDSFGRKGSKHMFEASIRLDLYKKAQATETNLATAVLSLNKKLLDAFLSCEITLNDPSILKQDTSTTKPKYTLNLSVPLIFDSELTSKIVKLPGLLFYFIKESHKPEVYLLAELAGIRIEFNRAKKMISVECDKFRMARAHLELDLDQLFRLLDERISLPRTQKRRYNSIKFKSNEFLFSFFPTELISSHSWLFCKLQSFEMLYELLENSANHFELAFDKPNENMAHKDKDSHISRNVFLKVGVEDDVFSRSFDFNRWLNYCCMNSSEPVEYTIGLLAILPDHFKMNLKAEPGSVNGQWAWNVRFETQPNLIVDLSSLKTVYFELYRLFVDYRTVRGVKLGDFHRQATVENAIRVRFFEHMRSVDRRNSLQDEELNSDAIDFINPDFIAFVLHLSVFEPVCRYLDALPDHVHHYSV
jgi:Fe-S cluster assembly iron-binding protein IscA